MSALPSRNQKRTARTDDLFRITGMWSELNGVAALPASSRPWVFWFVALIKCGYTQVKAPVWAITKSHFNSCARTTCSDSSTRRALRWLVEHDYISKRNLRLGRDCHGVIIDINIDRFNFLIRPPKPAPVYSVEIKRDDMCDKDLHQSARLGDNSMSNRDNSFHSSTSIVTNRIARSKNNAKKLKDGRKPHNHHPMQHTLWIIAKARPDWVLINARIKNGLARKNGDDGIDWDYWDKRWYEMTVPEREFSAKNQILPLLTNSPRTTKSDPTLPNINTIISAISSPKKYSKKDEQSLIIPRKDQLSQTLSDEEKNDIIEAQKILYWQRKNMN